MLKTLWPIALLSLLIHGGASPRPLAAPLARPEALSAALGDLPGAVAAFGAGRYGEAARRFQQVREALPGPERAASTAALLGMDGPRDYRRLLSSLETNHGLSLLRARRFREALAPLAAAVAADPGSAAARANLGIGQLHLKRFAEATATLAEGVRRGEADARLLLQLGRAAYASGDDERAGWALRRAARLARAENTPAARGTAVEAAILEARLAADAGRLEAARKMLEEVLRRVPGEVHARYRLLQVLGRLGDREAIARHRATFERHAAAMAAIQSALVERPEEVGGLHWIADGYARLGLDHLAEAHYRQLLARDRHDAVARAGLFDLMRRHQGQTAR